MKKTNLIKVIILYLLTITYSSFAQNLHTNAELVNNFNKYKNELNGKLSNQKFYNLNRIEKVKKLHSELLNLSKLDTNKKNKINKAINKKTDNQETDIAGLDNSMANILFEIEHNSSSFSFENLSDTTIYLIQCIETLEILELLRKAIEEKDNISIDLAIKNKLIRAISKQMNLVADNKFAWYNYSTNHKSLLKGISINSSNDLFTPMGIGELSGIKIPNYLQRNDDRDYTGGVLIEIATDYLKFNRKRPTKSYQKILWGADVYTPYFRDTTVFLTDSSYNPKDRPHASFQYLGWSTCGISYHNTFRWETILKLGKIGGERGAILQTILHQDISNSPRPRGWAAQISNSGRIGWSLEYKPEWQLKKIINQGNKYYPELYLSGFLNGSIGTYMTFTGVGLQISNKAFLNSNTNFVSMRTKVQKEKNILWEYWLISARSSIRYVFHNTMLEGYGVLSTTESMNDAYTPKSIYYLKENQIKRIVATTDLIISKQSRYATFFYTISSISPETTFSKIGIKKDGVEMDISNRWHIWSTIGLCFNMDFISK